MNGDGNGVEYGKDGVNAGVASNLGYLPHSDTTIVLLANQECDIWSLHREIKHILE